MANPITFTDRTSHDNRAGVELRWPSSVIWRDGEPAVRKITTADVWDALMRGIEDFRAMPSHALFLCVVYPVIGILLARAMFGYHMLPLIYPMTAGFALLGPVAAIGLYELSRRREAGLDVRAADVLEVRKSPSLGAIVLLSLVLAAIFVGWLYTADLIHRQILGTSPTTVSEFSRQLFNTPQGMQLLVVGNIVGFLFAVVVLVISVVSFPLLIDRKVSAATAVRTSVRASIENPGPVALWGLIVAVGLALGALPLFVGLAVTLPVLGHATWHLYRKLVVPE
jgi:uncharacterized membrane protein